MAFSRSDAWAFEWSATAPAEAYAFHFDGHRWRRMQMAVSLRAAAAPRPRNIWAAGPVPSGPNYGLPHWTGRRWHTIPFPDLNLPTGHFIYQVHVVSDNAAGAWVAADIGAPDFRFPAGVVLLKWNGRTWTQVKVRTSSTPSARWPTTGTAGYGSHRSRRIALAVTSCSTTGRQVLGRRRYCRPT